MRAQAIVALAVAAASVGAQAATTELISRSYVTGMAVGGGVDGLTADGRYVLFRSGSARVVPNDTNDTTDIFLMDRATGRAERINVSSSGQEDNGGALAEPSVTRDGRYISFDSLASNLVPGDTNDGFDVFVRDRVAGTTERVSVTSGGKQGLGYSYDSEISDDGRYVVFVSSSALVVDAPLGGTYVRDRVTRQTRLVAAGCGYPVMSGDGRWVAVHCEDDILAGDRNGLPDIYVRDLVSGDLTWVTKFPHPTGFVSADAWSRDGKYLLIGTNGPVITSDTNEETDVYLYDRAAATFERITLTSDDRQVLDGGGGYASISDDNRYVAFSGTGAFTPDDTNGGHFDNYVRDRQTHTTIRASLTASGEPLNSAGYYGGISGNGQVVAFDTRATNAVPDVDNNRLADVYVRVLDDSTTPPVMAFKVRPGTIAFGTVSVGSASPWQRCTVTNSGTAPLTIRWIGIAGINAAEFAHHRECPGVLAAGARCFARVAFTPLSPGNKFARLVVSAGGIRRNCKLTGTGE